MLPGEEFNKLDQAILTLGNPTDVTTGPTTIYYDPIELHDIIAISSLFHLTLHWKMGGNS